MILERHLAQSREEARTGFAPEIRVEGRDLCRVDGRPIPMLAQQIHGVGQLERSAVAGCRVDIDCGLEFQQKIESGEAVIVGVNRYTAAEEKPIETLRIEKSAEDRQIEKLRQLRKRRNNGDVERSLAVLCRTAAVSAINAGSQNLMPPLLDAVRCYATLGEICGVLRDVFGTYEERPNI